MNNDMKLIMEAWNSYVNERIDLVSPTMEPGVSSRDISQAAADTIETAPAGIYQNWKKKRGEWSEEGGWWLALRWLIDLGDPTGITDWPDVEDAWDRYMEWYNLQDSDPNKNPEIGNNLFVHFVFTVVLAIPGIDLFSELSKRIGLKLTQGFFKSVLLELGAMLGIYAAVSDFPSNIAKILGYDGSYPVSGTDIHQLSLKAQKWYDDMSDVVKHGEKKTRLPLGGQKGSSKEYDTFDKKKKAVDPDYYPPQNKD
tara:strand:+ start:44 stop:805 length:762 start_codon:yes stop_codon:yes gene_type:complete